MRWKLAGLGAVLAGAVAIISFNWSQPGNPNIVAPTMGGQQFWTDVYYHVGWRIQHNLVTDHYRLLDPEDHRHAWGTYDECLTHFATLRSTLNLSYEDKPLVFLIKGLGGMESSFRGLRWRTKAITWPMWLILPPVSRLQTMPAISYVCSTGLRV